MTICKKIINLIFFSLSLIAKFLHLGDEEPGLGSSGSAAMPALYPLRQGIIYPLWLAVGLSDWLSAPLSNYLCKTYHSFCATFLICTFIASLLAYTVQKDTDFPVPSLNVTNQTLPGRVWLVTSMPRTGKTLSFFTVYYYWYTVYLYDFALFHDKPASYVYLIVWINLFVQLL